MDLQKKIEQYIETLDARFGIYIKHLETNEEVNIHSDKLFQMASVVKIPILAKVFELIDQGKINLNDRILLEKEDLVGGSGVFKEMEAGMNPTIKDLATMMIIVSDNLATDRLLKLTSAKDVESLMYKIGIKHVYIKHSIWELLCLCVGCEPQPYDDEFFQQLDKRLKQGELDQESIVFSESTENNVSSPLAMSQLVEKIVRKELISENASKQIHDIMLKQQYKHRIGGNLPDEAVIANKTGTLGTVFNDSGVVYLPEDKGCYVITVYTHGYTKDFKGEEAIADISKFAYDYFVEKNRENV